MTFTIYLSVMDKLRLRRFHVRSIPANTRRSANAGTMLVQRQKR